MDKDYTNLQHLYVRLPEKGDEELIKIMKRDYYDHQLITEKTYNLWLNKDYDAYFESLEKSKKGEPKFPSFVGVNTFLYYLIDNGNIVGSGSIRLNPEDNPELSIYG